MKSALLGNGGAITATQQLRDPVTQRPIAHAEQISVDQLARAVGDHALRQAEIDQKMATRILELRDALASAKDEITSLRTQLDRLIQGISDGVAAAQQRNASTTKSATLTSLASLRSR